MECFTACCHIQYDTHDIVAFWAPIPAITPLHTHVQVFRMQARAKIQVAKNWNNPCYPGGNIALLSMALTSTPSLPSSLSSPWGPRRLPSLLPSSPCCWSLGDRKRYLGNASVTQDKLPWTRPNTTRHVLIATCQCQAWQQFLIHPNVIPFERNMNVT